MLLLIVKLDLYNTLILYRISVISVGKTVPKTSKVIGLCPIKDSNSLLRAGIWIKIAELPEKEKRLKLLHEKYNLTEIVLNKFM